MATLVFSIACILLLFSATTSAHDDAVLKFLVKHIEHLDAKIEQLEVKHDREIEALRESAKLREGELIRKLEALKERADLREDGLVRKLEDLDQRVTTLEDKNDALTRANYRCRSKLFHDVLKKTHKSEISDKNAIHGKVNWSTDSREKATRKINSGTEKESDVRMAKPRRAQQSDYQIAFTAYMDHDANSLGNGQALMYNQILLNDGNGYNKHTGIFTAPIAGVYSFTFFIGQRGPREAYAALNVNSDNKVDAKVQTNHNTDDGQGGNSVVLKIAAGDVVYIKASGSHLEGSDSGRYTTFTGFLLYPTEGGSAVVGK